MTDRAPPPAAPAAPGRAALPWTLVRLVSPAALFGAPAPGEVLVRTEDGTRAGLAEAVRQEGVRALPHGELPLRHVSLPPGPTLDDLLCAYLCLDPPEAAHSGPLCAYAAQVREGLLPGEVPPERSLAGVCHALVELHRDDDKALLARAGLLLAQALAAVAAGRSPLREDLLDGQSFSRERTYLLDDQRRFVRDRACGQIYEAHIGPLPATLLWLRQPTSILYRLFAFRDPAAPGGHGFDLVAVERPGQIAGARHVALFADPGRRLPLREVLIPLCAALTARERAADPEAPPWYDGARHGHGRLASPRRGTRLPGPLVLGLVSKALRARRVSPSGAGAARQKRPGEVWLGALLATGLGLLSPRLPAPAPQARGDWSARRLPQGPPASPAERTWLLQHPGRRYALLLAASEYPARERGGLGPLRTPARDVCALRHLLVRRFGYREQDILTLADAPCLAGSAGPPTRQQLLWAIEHLPVGRDDTLLFYYAGHGAIEDEPGGRYGYLQLAGWEQAGLSREDRGLRMRVLAELLRDKIAARHQLLLIDSCHSGEAAVVRGDDPAGLRQIEAPARAGWAERPVYAVITAAGTADLALEERLLDAAVPHSLFVRALLEGLSYAPGKDGCRLRADQEPGPQPDGLVTDGELFKYVARRVPELRAGLYVPGLPDDAQRQVPEWNPWAAAPRGGEGVRLGEFLFAPRPPDGACTADADADAEPPECARCLP